MYTVVTHDGKFHPDDVFAIATLQLNYGVNCLQVIRSRDATVIETADIVVDVGGVYDTNALRFDHHQNGAPVRENGIPYAAFGLVWQHYGIDVTHSESVAEYIEERVAQPIDAGDNGITLYDINDYGVAPFELFQVISSYRPQARDEAVVQKNFMQAVAFARELLQRLINYQCDREALFTQAATLYQNHPPRDGVLVLDEWVPTEAFSDYDDVRVLVRPDGPDLNGNWIAKVIPYAETSFANKALFPEAWAGLHDDELQNTTGINDAIFCHRGRFIFVAGSKASALNAARESEPQSLPE
jgi:uncharacterized UPF0160 family protein